MSWLASEWVDVLQRGQQHECPDSGGQDRSYLHHCQTRFSWETLKQRPTVGWLGKKGTDSERASRENYRSIIHNLIKHILHAFASQYFAIAARTNKLKLGNERKKFATELAADEAPHRVYWWSLSDALADKRWQNTAHFLYYMRSSNTNRNYELTSFFRFNDALYGRGSGVKGVAAPSEERQGVSSSVIRGLLFF